MKKHQDVSNYAGFYDFEIEKAERNLRILKDRSKLDEEDIERNIKNFFDYFKQHDERRGTNLLTTFPEFKKLTDVNEVVEEPLPEIKVPMKKKRLSIFDIR